MTSCGTSDSALSEMDRSSITMPGVMSSEDVSKEVQQLNSMTDGTLKCEDLTYSPTLTDLQSKLTAWKKELQSHRTSRLWRQYLDMIHLLKMHHNAERTGQWEEQLHILKSMQPYLAAAGHHQYAKAISLFLVEMTRMKKGELENWNKLAKMHVIRRSYSHWSGIATDLIIEQVLMCSLKSIGGLSHRRGWSEAQQLSWLLSRPTCAEYNHSLQKLTSVSFLSSDQHTLTHSWSTGARMTRDKQDVDKLTTFFTTYDPFSPDPTLHCIATGVVASTSANVDDAQSIGVKILDDMVDEEVNQCIFPVSSKAKTLAARPEIEVNATATATQTDEARQEAFSYELCSYPPTHFDHKLFQCSGAKSELADAIWRQVDLEHIEKPAAVFPQRETNDISIGEAHVTRQIIDGGSLLHRIPRSKCHMTWIQLVNIYVQYVIRVYGPDSIIIFDDYPTHPTTKDEARMRRSGTAAIISIQNVKQFISILSYHLTARGVTCHHAVADADHLIAKVAIESATESSTVVNAEDTDVLILLLHMTPDNFKDIFFAPHIPKQIKRTKRRRVWPIQDVQRRLGRELCQRLLFIHAFSGCDTTARPYGMGKGTTLSKVMNNLILGKCADTFTDVNSTKEDVIGAGDLAMRLLTGSNGIGTLAVQRYKEFKTKVLKEMCWLR